MVKIAKEDYTPIDCTSESCLEFNSIIKKPKNEIKKHLQILASKLEPQEEKTEESAGVIWIFLVIMSYLYFKQKHKLSLKIEQYSKTLKFKNRKIDELEEKIESLKKNQT